MQKRLISVICVVLLLVMLPMQSVEAKAKPKLSAKSKTITVGQTYTIKLKNLSTKAKVKWTTNKKSVVSISKKSGSKVVVKAKKSGTATITAKYKGKTYRCKITVKKKKTDKKEEVAENPVMNASKVELYYQDESLKDIISFDTTHKKEFQFKVTGTKQEVRTWELVGENKDFFRISDDGKVTIFWEVSYDDKEVSADVKATLEDGTVLMAKVTQHSEIYPYIQQLFATFSKTYITDSMTEKEKAEKVAWYIGATSDYKTADNNWQDIFLRGQGDCLASRYAVEYLCRYLGLKACACGDFEYHGCTVVVADGKNYMIVTGYNEPRPRSYMMYELSEADLEKVKAENPIFYLR